MGTADRIRKLGFRRWHERTLIEGHAYLVTGFLALVLAFGGFELLTAAEGAGALLTAVGLTTIGVLVCGFGLHRYFRMLVLAQNLGHRATCGQCQTYAAFNVLPEAGGRRPVETADSLWLKVRCRHCGNEWQI